jgi:hypothetical protein
MRQETWSESELSQIQLPLVCAYAITYNGKKFLKRCFETLQNLTDYENCRFVLVDNGSSDGSGDYVRERFSDVDILRVFPNEGYPHGANQAIDDARRRGAKYIVLMNDDIAILHSQWLREAIVHLERDPSIGVIGFLEATADDEHELVAESKLVEAQYLSSPVMIMSLELINQIGKFDEVYFVICDENDLGARAQAAGYRIATLQVPIFHFGGGTNQKHSVRTAYLQMRNGIRFCLKNDGAMRACSRAARIVDVACNPWPVTFDKQDAAHHRMRNSGNVLLNSLLWLRAVSWNIVRLPETLRIRAAERRLTIAARAARQDHARASQPRARAAIAANTPLESADMGVQI